MNTTRKKLYSILGNNNFKEFWPNIITYNYLNFLQYSEKLDYAKSISGENDTVITGTGYINNIKCMFIVFEPLFIMGSIGVVSGEKITRAFNYATKKRLPVISISASGGARMQEGVISLMQMAKTSAAVYNHSKKKLLYISVISDPTLGGVTASFASLADIIIGEKGARFGFTGRRIIEETTHERLPDNFQTVEYAKSCGMVDIITEKENLKNILPQLITLHCKGDAKNRFIRFFKHNSS